MFHWFSTEAGKAGLEQLRTEFGEMLTSGQHAFDMATDALFGRVDPETVRKDLFATDKRINKAERRIRRELVVHASVHGTTDFPACLVLMSIVKDAERVGDNAKNLFDLAKLAPHPPAGADLQTFLNLKERISRAMGLCHEIFDLSDESGAKKLIVDSRAVEDLCDGRIEQFVEGEETDEPCMVATYVLIYRYFKRTAAHVRNIASSVVQPLHKLDFTSKITADDSQ